MPRRYDEGTLNMEIIRETAERCKNWGRWGPDDEIGTLNFITPEDVIAAAGLIRKGRVFSLGLNFDNKGPQSGLWGNRFNPIHTMTATGTDAVAGNQDAGKFRYADDMISLPLQCGTQWDALGHIFYGDKMWNGYDARLVDSNGAHKNAIDKIKDRTVGRGVLLDVARYAGVESLEEGMAITNADLDETAEAQGVDIRRGDFVIVRTGMDGPAAAGGRLGRLRRRRRAGDGVRDRGLDLRERDCRDLRRHLGLRSAPQRNHRGAAALALGGDPHDRHHHG